MLAAAMRGADPRSFAMVMATGIVWPPKAHTGPTEAG
jgi:hypothetical protein